MTAAEILDREFLGLRAKILEIAAVLDRIDCAEGDPDGQQQDLIARGLQILTGNEDNRAIAVQMLFSREYDQLWRDSYKV